MGPVSFNEMTATSIIVEERSGLAENILCLCG